MPIALPRSFLTVAVLALAVIGPVAWYLSTPRPTAAAMSTSAAAATAGGAAPSASPSGAIVVYVTVPSAEVGESLASKLVESQLAACVNLLPGVTSIYSWKGKVEKDAELLLIIKSRSELLPELTAFVRANHPYDEPEVVGLPILGGSVSYLQWLMDNTRGAAATAGAGAGVEAAGAAGQGPAAGKA
ncbi:hypothetical protein PLESTB_000092000 [Pleodorina starrii]|uniref:Uncharacterized protein n=1 Tax=Pleodorina starrii TaxID=330485 RepID=A0A9W6EXL0_9CHLO|nr:hypothetical protein PLESTM_000088600 [Pleodorina starrii]GLC48390.1 hypothetical protein PLESTB_000092000 [Pleodorina starrii]GLC71711.1 hypothetical protein PLESTF_001157700 [Pleodorina starrii]